MTPADEWLICRLDDPPQIRLVRNQYGSWDVMLRIDGGYSERDALRMMEHHRAEVTALHAEVLREIRAAGDVA